MTQTIKIEGDNITLDLLLTNVFGLSGQSLVNDAIRLNPHLAELSFLIPLGTVVTLPDPPKASKQELEAIDLFKVLENGVGG